MIKKNSNSDIIVFSQKVLNKESLLKFTPDFIFNIYSLYHLRKSGTIINPKLLEDELGMIRHMIKSAISAEIDEYSKTKNHEFNNILRITFEKGHPIPIADFTNNTDEQNLLFNILFKKISWDEVNIFRKFLGCYLEYFLSTFHKDAFPNKNIITNTANDVTYVTQELLQNANQHSYGTYEYEFSLRFSNNQFLLTVTNFAKQEKVNRLISIVNDIRKADDLNELLLEYMMADDKHLGVISSITNFNISEYQVLYKNEIVNVFFKINI